MDNDQAHNFKNENLRLIVYALKKLRELKGKMLEEYKNGMAAGESSNSNNEAEMLEIKETNFANVKNESFYDGKRPDLEKVGQA